MTQRRKYDRQFKIEAVDDMTVEDLIVEEEIVITISHLGYVKRLSVSQYKKQQRGGKGVKGIATREEDFAEHLFIALTHAIQRRQPTGGLLHHSDRGSQYTSNNYQKLLKEHQITCSMSRKGNCWDNAVMDSFFATLKTELMYHETSITREDAKLKIFDYIELFYNCKRRHSSLRYKSPAEFEMMT